MRQRRLGSAGPSVGAMSLSGVYGKADDRESIVTIHEAIDLGVTLGVVGRRRCRAPVRATLYLRT